MRTIVQWSRRRETGDILLAVIQSLTSVRKPTAKKGQVYFEMGDVIIVVDESHCLRLPCLPGFASTVEGPSILRKLADSTLPLEFVASLAAVEKITKPRRLRPVGWALTPEQRDKAVGMLAMIRSLSEPLDLRVATEGSWSEYKADGALVSPPGDFDVHVYHQHCRWWLQVSPSGTTDAANKLTPGTPSLTLPLPSEFEIDPAELALVYNNLMHTSEDEEVRLLASLARAALKAVRISPERRFLSLYRHCCPGSTKNLMEDILRTYSLNNLPSLLKLLEGETDEAIRKPLAKLQFAICQAVDHELVKYLASRQSTPCLALAADNRQRYMCCGILQRHSQSPVVETLVDCLIFLIAKPATVPRSLEWWYSLEMACTPCIADEAELLANLHSYGLHDLAAKWEQENDENLFSYAASELAGHLTTQFELDVLARICNWNMEAAAAAIRKCPSRQPASPLNMVDICDKVSLGVEDLQTYLAAIERATSSRLLKMLCAAVAWPGWMPSPTFLQDAEPLLNRMWWYGSGVSVDDVRTQLTAGNSDRAFDLLNKFCIENPSPANVETAEQLRRLVNRDIESDANVMHELLWASNNPRSARGNERRISTVLASLQQHVSDPTLQADLETLRKYLDEPAMPRLQNETDPVDVDLFFAARKDPALYSPIAVESERLAHHAAAWMTLKAEDSMRLARKFQSALDNAVQSMYTNRPGSIYLHLSLPSLHMFKDAEDTVAALKEDLFEQAKRVLFKNSREAYHRLRHMTDDASGVAMLNMWAAYIFSRATDKQAALVRGLLEEEECLRAVSTPVNGKLTEQRAMEARQQTLFDLPALSACVECLNDPLWAGGKTINGLQLHIRNRSKAHVLVVRRASDGMLLCVVPFTLHRDFVFDRTLQDVAVMPDLSFDALRRAKWSAVCRLARSKGETATADEWRDAVQADGQA